MARAAVATSKTKTRPAKMIGPASTAKAVKPAAKSASSAWSGGAATAKVGRAVLVTKGELREQVASLEAKLETLRAKAVVSRKDARAAAARIQELEGQVASLSVQTAVPTSPKGAAPAATVSKRSSKHAATASRSAAAGPDVLVAGLSAGSASEEGGRDEAEG